MRTSLQPKTSRRPDACGPAVSMSAPTWVHLAHPAPDPPASHLIADIGADMLPHRLCLGTHRLAPPSAAVIWPFHPRLNAAFQTADLSAIAWCLSRARGFKKLP